MLGGTYSIHFIQDENEVLLIAPEKDNREEEKQQWSRMFSDFMLSFSGLDCCPTDCMRQEKMLSHLFHVSIFEENKHWGGRREITD